MIRIRFGGPFCYTFRKEPLNSIGHDLGPYSRILKRAHGTGIAGSTELETTTVPNHYNGV